PRFTSRLSTSHSNAPSTTFFSIVERVPQRLTAKRLSLFRFSKYCFMVTLQVLPEVFPCCQSALLQGLCCRYLQRVEGQGTIGQLQAEACFVQCLPGQFLPVLFLPVLLFQEAFPSEIFLLQGQTSSVLQSVY